MEHFVNNICVRTHSSSAQLSSVNWEQQSPWLRTESRETSRGAGDLWALAHSVAQCSFSVLAHSVPACPQAALLSPAQPGNQEEKSPLPAGSPGPSAEKAPALLTAAGTSLKQPIPSTVTERRQLGARRPCLVSGSGGQFQGQLHGDISVGPGSVSGHAPQSCSALCPRLSARDFDFPAD